MYQHQASIGSEPSGPTVRGLSTHRPDRFASAIATTSLHTYNKRKKEAE